MPEITQADREAACAYMRECAADGQLAVAMTTKPERLLKAFAAHREAAVAAYIATTTPPEPRELTAEIVKELLPMQVAEIDGNSLALYKSPLGAWISWTHHRGEFSLKLNDRTLDMARLTDRKLAELIAAIGIDAAVK